MPGYAIGLDVGARAVKAAVLKGGLRGFEVEDFLSVELPRTGGAALSEPGLEPAPDAGGGPASPSPEAVAAAIRSVLDTVGQPQATLVAALPASRVSAWILELPFADERRIAQTLPVEVENHVPWDLAEMVLDWQVLERAPGATKLFTMMVQRERLQEAVTRLQEAGADPRHLAVDAAELSRLQPPSEGTDAIVDIGASRTLICVAAGRRTRAVRALDQGTEQLPKAQGAWLGGIRATLLAAEEGGAGEVSRLLVCGGGARHPDLLEALAAELGVPVEPLELPASPQHPESAPRPDPEHALAYALALRAFARRSEGGIEFRKGAFAYHADRKIAQRLVFSTIAALLLLGLVFLGLHIRQVARLHADLEQARQHLMATVQGAFPEVAATSLASEQSAIAVMQEQLTAVQARVEALQGHKNTPLDVLRALSIAVPDNIVVDVDEYSVDRDAIRMRGETDSFTSIDRIEAALQGNPSLAGAKKSDVNKGREGKTRFLMTIPRDPQVAEGQTPGAGEGAGGSDGGGDPGDGAGKEVGG